MGSLQEELADTYRWRLLQLVVDGEISLALGGLCNAKFLEPFLKQIHYLFVLASLGQQGMGSLSHLSCLPFEHHAWLEKMKLSSALPQQWEEKRLRCGMDKQSTQDTVQ